MKIKTKYEIGDKVYVVFKENIKKDEISVYIGNIEQICIDNEGVIYYIDTICEEFKENEIIPINDKLALAKKIDELNVEGLDE